MIDIEKLERTLIDTSKYVDTYLDNDSFANAVRAIVTNPTEERLLEILYIICKNCY